MIVAIHQPQYLPWIGYFDKMDQADVFVLLDTVQFKKNEWQNRNRVKTPDGWQWLTVPVVHRFPQRIDEVRIAPDDSWGRKHWQALQTHYGAAPFFAPHAPFFADCFARPWERLVDLSGHLIEYLAGALGIGARLIRASTGRFPEDATGRLVAICRHLGASAYLAGRDGQSYMDLDQFAAAGIAVKTQDFACPVYPQRYGAFVPDLSVVDLLFNCGQESLARLRRQRGEA
ncbi:MAG: WbqC family protein [candidate division NC10 bacterium]|nr:WbqC family protein [candidate division NC10 bacterium]